MSGMRLSRRRSRETDDVVKASMSELILFMLFFFLIYLGEKDAVQIQTTDDSKSKKHELKCEAQYGQCKSRSGSSNDCLHKLKMCLKIKDRYPPVISLSDVQGFSFKENSSVLSSGFETLLQRRTIPKILRIIQSDRYEVTVIEIIGHTDKQTVLTNVTNLDKQVGKHLDLNRHRQELFAADNAGLGLARAIAVRNYLKRNSRLKSFPMLTYSAAFTVRPDGLSATKLFGAPRIASSKRRRIEIRLRGELRNTQ